MTFDIVSFFRGLKVVHDSFELSYFALIIIFFFISLLLFYFSSELIRTSCILKLGPGVRFLKQSFWYTF
jgi:hypothetical protein